MRISVKFRRRIAFTLAEVLITLGIIGVVAAMTIPTLIQSTQERELKVAWKKVYSTFSQAYLTMKYEDTIDWTSRKAMKDSFKPYFKIIADCDIAGDTCWRSDATLRTRNLSNTAYAFDFSTGYPGIVTADGIDIIFSIDSAVKGWIMVDVNGNKKPNVLGKDVFGMRFTPEKSFPFTQAEMGTCNPPANGSAGVNYTGLGCSEYYVYNE